MLLILLSTIMLIISYFYNKVYFFASILLIYSFLKFIFFKIGFHYAPTTFTIVYVALLVTFFIDFFLNYNFNLKSKALFQTLLITIVLFLVYIFLIDSGREVSSLIHIEFFKHYFWGFLLFIIMVSSSYKKNIDVVKLENIIFYILLIQISIATMQYFSKNVSDYFKIVEYSWQGNTTITLGDSLIKSKIINGTFFRAANYGNTIAIIIVYFFSQILYGKFKYNKFKIVVLILGIITVLLTGIRTSAGSMVLGMFFVYFFKNKRKALMLLGIVIVLLFTYQQVLVGIGKLGLSQGTIENPFSRLSAALVMFSGDINTIEETTITRSLSIFPYALQNPFFGIGQYYISGYTGIESITDAFLLFHIAEIGIFGLLILLIPHFKVLQRIKKINKQGYYTVLSLFILLLVQTVTDAGLFSHYGMIFFFFLSALIYLKNTLIYEKK